MIEVFPQLRDAQVEYAWGGTLGFAFDLMPHAGEIDGVFYAIGYAGHGVAMATYLGKTVVVDTRIWGCERAYARSHPQIRPPFTANPGEPYPECSVN